ncbi:glutathione S-transferase [Mesorhizobium sp. J18]|uniref:glutathione S-transferase family protein n=1 Tax=Mesorhizobium sp. J18 TaxID=935263 RepID=UPI00119BB9A5|nr:glutathione S-transferase family protein [Mesorhizobium sp. J18]TWG97149.1 glutathione S-transferase [Mesorhizobium sp. J18]
MPLELYFHPLASFCHKVLIAFYENEIPFEPVIVDLADEASTAAFKRVWPMAKMPVLRDGERGATVAESTIVIEYLDAFHPGTIRFVPATPEAAWQTRMWDRFFDQYVQEPMQKIVTDRIRPEGKSDPFGVEQAKALLLQSYDLLEEHMTGRQWAIGEDFTLADCAATPALFYANAVVPIGDRPALRAYAARLMARPSFQRIYEETTPYFRFFPMPDKPVIVTAS